MSYKHSQVDDYPYLAYASTPNTAQAQSTDVSALDSRLDAIETSGWVTTSRIADDAVTGAKIADNAVDTAQIKDDAVTNAKIADNAVDTAQIKDDAVTAAKIAE